MLRQTRNHFRVIAIRAISPPETVGEKSMRAIRSIQKAVYGKSWLYLYQGYKLDEPGDSLIVIDDSHSDEMLYSSDDLCVSVSAIVGENGSGKSSTVELMVRLINNLAVALMGEEKRSEASEHLYFIENVFGCMVFQEGNQYYQLRVAGRDVTLGRYCFNHSLKRYLLGYEKSQLLDREAQKNGNKPIKRTEKENEWLERLFYTVIYNYSMYSFVYSDYEEEQTIEERWERWKKKELTQEKVWLNGLFHKNDGYQTPIVLNPMRENGIIDIVNENKLTRERLLSMLFYKEKRKGTSKEEYPFRTINQNREIVGLKMTYYDNPNFSRENVVGHLNLNADIFKTNFGLIRRIIIGEWCKIANLTYNADTKDNELAWDYVVYKTLKISKTYNRYHKINKNLRLTRKRDLLAKHFLELYNDRSHVTVKLRRALFFLKTDVFRNSGNRVYWLRDVEQAMKDADISWDNDISYSGVGRKSNQDKPEHDELLPPPIYDISLLIIDRTKIREDGSFDRRDPFPFAGLSSGEKQVTGAISNFVYHLLNINSVWKYGHKAETAEEELVKYKYVNVVFDEVELYFHPDLQRRFVKILIDALHNITLEYIKGVNILIVTHSPFVLSDIPFSNVLFFRTGEKEVMAKETFASNIHQTLSSSFFMDYAIGDVARLALQEVFEMYARLSNMRGGETDQQRWREKEDYYKYVGSIIGDDYLRNTYQMMMRELMKEYQPQLAMEEEQVSLGRG